MTSTVFKNYNCFQGRSTQNIPSSSCWSNDSFVIKLTLSDLFCWAQKTFHPRLQPRKPHFHEPEVLLKGQLGKPDIEYLAPLADNLAEFPIYSHLLTFFLFFQ